MVYYSGLVCLPQWSCVCARVVYHHTDTAYTLDPRVKKFKESEKEEKEARKKARAEAAKQEALERERVGDWLARVCHLTVM